MKPGEKIVTRFIEDGEEKSQVDICIAIARETWMQIHTLEADSKKPVSRRMRKGERERVLAKMSGLKTALRLALGQTYSYMDVQIDAFLNGFQQERLAASGKEPQ